MKDTVEKIANIIRDPSYNGWDSDDLAQEIIDLILSSQWQPMETVPKDGTEILLISIGDMGLCYWRDDDVMTGWTWGLGNRFNNPTHWMPLPNPPQETP